MHQNFLSRVAVFYMSMCLRAPTRRKRSEACTLQAWRACTTLQSTCSTRRGGASATCPPWSGRWEGRGSSPASPPPSSCRAPLASVHGGVPRTGRLRLGARPPMCIPACSTSVCCQASCRASVGVQWLVAWCRSGNVGPGRTAVSASAEETTSDLNKYTQHMSVQGAFRRCQHQRFPWLHAFLHSQVVTMLRIIAGLQRIKIRWYVPRLVPTCSSLVQHTRLREPYSCCCSSNICHLLP